MKSIHFRPRSTNGSDGATESGDMMKRCIAVVAAGLAIAGAGAISAPAVIAAGEGCGGPYPAAVEVASVHYDGHEVGYCSDGTLSAIRVPATADDTSSCGENYPATVEANSGQGVGFCSDGAFDGVGDLLP